MPLLRRPTLALVTIAALAAASSAPAATVPHQVKQNGAGACQGALPAFAGTLRARPLALQNEGAAAAFATCSLLYDDAYSAPVLGVSVRLTNNTPADVLGSCTLVDGSVQNPASYLTRSVAIPANGSASLIFFNTDYPEPVASITRPNLSCALPTGQGIGYVVYFSSREVLP